MMAASEYVIDVTVSPDFGDRLVELKANWQAAKACAEDWEAIRREYAAKLRTLRAERISHSAGAGNAAR